MEVFNLAKLVDYLKKINCDALVQQLIMYKTFD